MTHPELEFRFLDSQYCILPIRLYSLHLSKYLRMLAHFRIYKLVLSHLTNTLATQVDIDCGLKLNPLVYLLNAPYLVGGQMAKHFPSLFSAENCLSIKQFVVKSFP